MTLASGEHDDVEFGELLKVAIGGDEAPAGGSGERCGYTSIHSFGDAMSDSAYRFQRRSSSRGSSAWRATRSSALNASNAAHAARLVSGARPNGANTAAVVSSRSRLCWVARQKSTEWGVATPSNQRRASARRLRCSRAKANQTLTSHSWTSSWRISATRSGVSSSSGAAGWPPRISGSRTRWPLAAARSISATSSRRRSSATMSLSFRSLARRAA